MAYRLTRRARRDVLNIWVHIAEDNEAAADRFIDLLTQHYRLLGNTPTLDGGVMRYGRAIAASP